MQGEKCLEMVTLYFISCPPKPWLIVPFFHLIVAVCHGFLITVSLQVLNGAILQQVFVVEYVVQYQMCDDCHRVEAKDFWKAVVQVRQKVGTLALKQFKPRVH